MHSLLGIVFGIIWGGLAAFINSRIAKKALCQKDIKAAKNARRLQMLIDIVALVIIVLLRNILPFSYELTLVSAIIALSLLTVVFLFVSTRE